MKKSIMRATLPHPSTAPLLKLLWATPLALDRTVPFPHDAASGRDHWKLAHALLYESGVPAAGLPLMSGSRVFCWVVL